MPVVMKAQRRWRGYAVLALGSAIFSAGVPARDTETIMLPDDQARYDELRARGAAESEARGLSQLEVGDARYYVIDRHKAYLERIASSLSDIYTYDSDISIRSGPLYREFIHLRLGGVGSPEVLLFAVDPALAFQVADFVKAKSDATRADSVAYRAYRFRIASCDGLKSPVDELTAALRTSAGSIGGRSATGPGSGAADPEEIIVDGQYYELTVRQERRIATSLGIGENDPHLLAPLKAVVNAIVTCSARARSETCHLPF